MTTQSAIMSLFQERTTSEILTNGEISGYVYAGPVESHRQTLEWVLFGNFTYPTQAPMTLRPVTRTEWNHTSLHSFVDKLAEMESQAEDWLFARAVCAPPERQLGSEEPVCIYNEADQVVGFARADGSDPLGENVRGLSSTRVVETWQVHDGYTPPPAATIHLRSDGGATLGQHTNISSGDHDANSAPCVFEVSNEYSRYAHAMARLRESLPRMA